MLLQKIMRNPEQCVFNLSDINMQVLAKAVNDGQEGVVFIADDDKILKGIVTDGDIRRFLAENVDSKDAIFDIINTHPISLHYQVDAGIALRTLRENSINVLPLVNDQNQIVGVVNFHDLAGVLSPERQYIKDQYDTVTHDENIERHISRYKFALNFLDKNGVILDCACGSGYGTNILSAKAKDVIGVDVSREAINYAETHHAKSNIKYLCENIENLSFEPSSFNAIVSFETFEHLPKSSFRNFLDNISCWLKADGLLIGSSPMLRFKDAKPFITNPYHINEMPKDELIEVFQEKFKDFILHFYYQKQDSFLPLTYENTGFCIIVAKKGNRQRTHKKPSAREKAMSQ